MDHDASLTSLVSSIRGEADLVIAEGFKSSAAPKVLVLDGMDSLSSVSNVIATVNGDGRAWGCPSYGFDDLESLAALISRDFLALVHREPATAPA